MNNEKTEMIFGVRAVIEAIQAGKEIDKIMTIFQDILKIILLVGIMINYITNKRA